MASGGIAVALGGARCQVQSGRGHQCGHWDNAAHQQQRVGGQRQQPARSFDGAVLIDVGGALRETTVIQVNSAARTASAANHQSRWDGSPRVQADHFPHSTAATATPPVPPRGRSRPSGGLEVERQDEAGSAATGIVEVEMRSWVMSIRERIDRVSENGSAHGPGRSSVAVSAGVPLAAVWGVTDTCGRRAAC